MLLSICRVAYVVASSLCASVFSSSHCYCCQFVVFLMVLVNVMLLMNVIGSLHF
jgi:hypothetical protein